jgi:hypothetical protein
MEPTWCLRHIGTCENTNELDCLGCRSFNLDGAGEFIKKAAEMSDLAKECRECFVFTGKESK